MTSILSGRDGGAIDGGDDSTPRGRAFAGLAAELESRNVQPVVVASHPRSGTHLLIDSLRLNCPECQSYKWLGERQDRLYLNVDHVGGTPPLAAGAVRRIMLRPTRPIIKTHAWPGFQRTMFQGDDTRHPAVFFDWLERSAAQLYIYRDGREVMRSLHTFMRDFDPTAHVSLGEFIRQEVHGMSRPRAWAEHVRQWSLRPDVYCVRMESLVRMPALTIAQVAERLRLRLASTISQPAQTRSPRGSLIQRLTQVRPQSTAILAHARARIPPWQEQLTRDDMKFLRDETGDLLVKLKYEQSSEWPDRY
ncbi:MAG TPA: sulfotransferase domain-containing protein [Steroidobacteraceae bacterium]|nr:sulfotransferase domain-containing protein [Steroidobacteraceae bacterium]